MHSILARRLESEILICIGSKTKFKVYSLFLQILLRSRSSLMVGEENGSYVVRRGAHD